ncbi:hypothetical protein RHGRI_037897 [Rhododendron griersonianum]|uniref:RINT1-like protein MAG2L n=1 Tax=Rhododendron griersonianum TaxID=479676 RepID=A0AAV6HWW0_9ERIC|nr:hypothetical protein RHGRI_037897 [Rhododendron griersonianum]
MYIVGLPEYYSGRDLIMALPNHRELSLNLLTFLDQNITTATTTAATHHHNRRILGFPDDNSTTPTNSTTYDNRHHCGYGLSSPTSSSSSSVFTLLHNTASDLEAKLSGDCAELDAHLLQLYQNLSKLLISWISRSVAAKSAIHKLNKATSLTPFGIDGPVKMPEMMCEELHRLAMELKRIETIRCYVDATRQLEAMVGDLEDAASFIMKQQPGKLPGANCSNPSVSIDHVSSQEKFFQAVRCMNDIEDLFSNPVRFQPRWCRLMKSVDSRIDKILTLLRPQVLADHRALLSSLGWPPKVLTSKIESGKISVLPNPLVLMQVDKQKAYSESFLALCALQHLQTRREKRQLCFLGQKKKLNIRLWAIDELVFPIASRLEYHFSKWADQPEFAFALVYKITRDFIVGVDDVLQPLIDRANLVSFSAKEAWVSAMVQTLSAFLANGVFSILVERYKERESRIEVISSWLHLIDHMVNFDKQILSLMSSEAYLFLGDFKRLEGYSTDLSVFSLFSDRTDWLRIWEKIELKEGRRKLKAESKDEGAWLVTKQEVGSAVDRKTEQFILNSREDHKAPFIVECALKLAWEMIERCRTLPGILTRIQFIRSTAAKVFWYLFDLLVQRYKRTEFIATDCSDESLLTLCEVINGARYCESKLHDWSDDVDFLEMRIAENAKDDATDNCFFFGEEIKSLADLEMNLLMEIIAGLLHQFETLSQDYIQTMELFEQEEDIGLFRASEGADFFITVEFLEALDTLRSRLCFMDACLNPKDFSDLWRSVADGLDHFIFGSILLSDYRFSDEGIKQFGADMRALFLVFQPFCARPEAFFPCIRNSLKLLEMDRVALRRLHVVSSNALDRTDWLHSCGVTHLSVDQAQHILWNRKYGIAPTDVIYEK